MSQHRQQTHPQPSPLGLHDGGHHSDDPDVTTSHHHPCSLPRMEQKSLPVFQLGLVLYRPARAVEAQWWPSG